MGYSPDCSLQVKLHQLLGKQLFRQNNRPSAHNQLSNETLCGLLIYHTCDRGGKLASVGIHPMHPHVRIPAAPNAVRHGAARCCAVSSSEANRNADKSVLQFLPFWKHTIPNYATKKIAPTTTLTVLLPDDDHQHSCCEAVYISTP